MDIYETDALTASSELVREERVSGCRRSFVPQLKQLESDGKRWTYFDLAKPERH
ncbi:hypothetical protein [Dyella silvatica]|uniref:hypothetical protein n=1 Tax=Dyella silvatica TaxID=2992128 RepID=UPI0022569D21|nr:hypothetical protein [Dyella silvatica]